MSKTSKPKARVKCVSRMRVVNDNYTEIYDYSGDDMLSQVESKELTLVDHGNGWSIKRDGYDTVNLDYCEASALIHSAFLLNKRDQDRGLQGLQGTRFKRIFTRVRKYLKKKGAKR